jgi:triosephosphate isomerase
MSVVNKVLIVGNWKMHLNVQQSSLLVQHLKERIKTHHDIEIVLAPSMLSLQPLSLEIDRRKFRLAAQNAFYVDEGAYTGEVSFAMLRDIVHYVIVGHSERRLYFHEDLEIIRSKVAAAVRSNISPILCVGETKREREAHETKQVLHDQLTTALANLTSEEIEQVVIAYEPVWAISTFGGELAKPGEVKPMMDHIRHEISELYGQAAAQATRVLYGGSVDHHSARGYLEIEGCDGVLVGSASLNYHAFSEIVSSAEGLQHERLKAEK